MKISLILTFINATAILESLNTTNTTNTTNLTECLALPEVNTEVNTEDFQIAQNVSTLDIVRNETEKRRIEQIVKQRERELDIKHHQIIKARLAAIPDKIKKLDGSTRINICINQDPIHDEEIKRSALEFYVARGDLVGTCMENCDKVCKTGCEIRYQGYAMYPVFYCKEDPEFVKISTV